jgi:hypothetical protein
VAGIKDLNSVVEKKKTASYKGLNVKGLRQSSERSEHMDPDDLEDLAIEMGILPPLLENPQEDNGNSMIIG